MSGAADTLEALLDALDARDGAKLTSMLGEDAVYDPGDGGRVIGAAEIRDAAIQRATALDESHADRAIMVSSDGQRASAEVTLRGRNQAGAAYAVPACIVVELEAGRVVRLTRYRGSGQ